MTASLPMALLAKQLDEMRCFWSDMKFPPFRMPETLGIPSGLTEPQLLVVPQLLLGPDQKPIQRMIELCRTKYPVRSPARDWDKELIWHERHPRMGTYAVFVEGMSEPSSTLAGMTVERVQAAGTLTMTLIEGLLFDLFNVWLGRQHPNQKNYTNCTGSANVVPKPGKQPSSPVIDWPERLAKTSGAELFISQFLNDKHLKNYVPRQVWQA